MRRWTPRTIERTTHMHQRLAEASAEADSVEAAYESSVRFAPKRLDRLVVAFARQALGLLRAETGRAQHAVHVQEVVPNAELPTDELLSRRKYQ